MMTHENDLAPRDDCASASEVGVKRNKESVHEQRCCTSNRSRHTNWQAKPNRRPIFATIDAHRKACTIYTEKCEVQEDFAFGSPECAATEAESARAGDEVFELADGFLEVVPTTSAGAIALLNHVSMRDIDDWRFPDRIGDRGTGEEFAIAIMRHVASALAKLSVESRQL
jgi:hypothetical protein